MTINQFKSWLADMKTAGTPLGIYYQADATSEIAFDPTNDDDALTIAALDELAGSDLYTPTTIITAEGLVDTNLELKYNYMDASPSVDKPGKINTIGSNINIFNSVFPRTTYASVDNTELITVSGILSGTSFNIVPNTNVNYKAGTYIFSIDTALPYKLKFKLDGNSPNYYSIAAGDKSVLINLTEDKTTLRVYMDGLTDGTELDFSFRLKIQEGSQATGYSKYGCGTIDFKIRNKNLFDKNNILIGKRIDSEGNVISANGYNTSADFIKVSPNTQYYRSQVLGANSSVCLYDKNKKFIPPRLQSGGNTFTTTSETEYLLTTFDDANLDTAQLEKGEIRTIYEAHKEQNITIPLPVNLELCKIGSGQDYLYKMNGK
jgi:hypothetical protein